MQEIRAAQPEQSAKRAMAPRRQTADVAKERAQIQRQQTADYGKEREQAQWKQAAEDNKERMYTSQARSADDMQTRLLRDVERAFALPGLQMQAVRADFSRGVEALSARGVSLREAVARLDPARIAGFWAQEARTFYPLDSGAKQYPLSMHRGQIPMFRVAAVLDQPVIPAVLQLALIFTLPRFPHFATRLRRGAFWYYLMPSPARYAVSPQGEACMAPFAVSDEREPLFRVLYRERQVAVEIFHVLTDGTGGMLFIQALLTEYFRLLGEPPIDEAQRSAASAPVHPGDTENAFAGFRDRERGDWTPLSRAVQIPADRTRRDLCRVEEYGISADALSQAAGRYGVSVTALMSAVILTACRQTARADKGRYQLQVPIDLRRRFPSRTLRNFSWYTVLSADAARAQSPQELAAGLHRQLAAATARDALRRNVSMAQRAIRRLRYVPLPWKTAVLRTAYRIGGDFFFTSTLSNLGRIVLPEPLGAHVREIALSLGPSPSNPYIFGLATVHNRAVLSVTCTAEDQTLLARLCEAARAYGLELTRKDDES